MTDYRTCDKCGEWHAEKMMDMLTNIWGTGYYCKACSEKVRSEKE